MEGRKVYYNLVSAAAEEVWLFFNERVTVSGPIIHRTSYMSVFQGSWRIKKTFLLIRNEINIKTYTCSLFLSDIIRIGFSTEYEYALYL